MSSSQTDAETESFLAIFSPSLFFALALASFIYLLPVFDKAVADRKRNLQQGKNRVAHATDEALAQEIAWVQAYMNGEVERVEQVVRVITYLV